MSQISRRFVLRGLIAAPAIVAVNNIMPIKALNLLAVPIEYVHSNWLTVDPQNGPFRTIQSAAQWANENFPLDREIMIDIKSGTYDFGTEGFYIPTNVGLNVGERQAVTLQGRLEAGDLPDREQYLIRVKGHSTLDFRKGELRTSAGWGAIWLQPFNEGEPK